MGVLLACSCTADRVPPPPPASAPATVSPSTPESVGDSVVARINGQPVYASCVAHQARAAQAASPSASFDEIRRHSMDECIGFELLAQRAATYAMAPAVLDARKVAAVRRLIESEFELPSGRPKDLPPAFSARVLERNRWRMQRVEYRASFFVRFTVAKNAGVAADRAAHDVALRVAEQLAGQRGMFPEHVTAVARRVSGSQPMEQGTADLADPQRLVKPYSDALFSIAEIGSTSAPVRTEWGWDVILWTDKLPARDITADQLAIELFDEMRLGYFAVWSKSIGKGTAVNVNADAFARLGAITPATQVQ